MRLIFVGQEYPRKLNISRFTVSLSMEVLNGKNQYEKYGSWVAFKIHLTTTGFSWKYQREHTDTGVYSNAVTLLNTAKS